MSYHETFEAEQSQMQMFFCVIFAGVFVVGALCALIYGFSWLASTEKVSTEIYGARHIKEQIESLENEYREHTHRYYDLKIKK